MQDVYFQRKFKRKVKGQMTERQKAKFQPAIKRATSQAELIHANLHWRPMFSQTYIAMNEPQSLRSYTHFTEWAIHQKIKAAT